ncbi:MAG: hypothetical protein CM1200mP12_10180 [Gammaproteobacteria bacterium]|nr:MAG: hypothetical protein CM1200mP12_10180 [Gammaproteobacteria bacterium]
MFWLVISTPFVERSTRQSTAFSPSLAETTAKFAMSPSVTAIFVPLSLLPFSSQVRFSTEGELCFPYVPRSRLFHLLLILVNNSVFAH